MYILVKSLNFLSGLSSNFLFGFKVTFEEFKEGFVAVLSEAVEGVSSDEDQDYDTDLGTTGK